MTIRQTAVFAVLIAVLFFAGGYAVGAYAERLARVRMEANWARERAALASAREAESARALALERTGAALAARLHESETAQARQGENVDEKIKRNSRGQPCLSGDITRLLNEHAARGAGLSAPSDDAAAAPAATAGDSGGGASDTGVALWARAVLDHYAVCRGRIDALRRWDAEVSGR